MNRFRTALERLDAILDRTETRLITAALAIAALTTRADWLVNSWPNRAAHALLTAALQPGPHLLLLPTAVLLIGLSRQR